VTEKASLKMPDVPTTRPSSPVETVDAAPTVYTRALVRRHVSEIQMAFNIGPFSSAMAVHTYRDVGRILAPWVSNDHSGS
jgi:hypothetical protein